MWLKQAEDLASQYSPEYSFLMALVKLVSFEGVPRDEIMSIVNAGPSRTVADLEAMTTKIWRLATEQYKIPSDYLIKKLPESKLK